MAGVSHWRHAWKTWTLPLLDRSRLLRLARRCHPGKVQLSLGYHNVNPSLFRQHAEFLKNEAEVMEIDRFLSRSSESKQEKPLVTLTFDDGYASFSREIVPILNEFKLPAAWFVPTAVIGTGDIFWFDRLRAAFLTSRRDRFYFQGKEWRLTSWNRTYVAAALSRAVKVADSGEHKGLVDELLRQLGEPPDSYLERFKLVSPGELRSLPATITLGSHSHTHSEFSHLDSQTIHAELTTSKKLLEEWTGRPIRHFAFPSGEGHPEAARLLRETGYTCGWTTQQRLLSDQEDPYQLPRVLIDDAASVAIVSAKMVPLFYQWKIL